MRRLFISLILVAVLAGCSKKPKKIVFDRNTQIDAVLADDAYASQSERLHAKDLARRYQEQQNEQIIEKPTLLSVAHEEQVALFEAKLADVPVPLGCIPIEKYFAQANPEANQVVLGYQCDALLDELALYYASAMEPFGWQLNAQFGGDEQMFVFVKHKQQCIISLRKSQGWFYQRSNTQLILFLAYEN